MSQRKGQPLLIGCIGATAIGVLAIGGAWFLKMVNPRIPYLDMIPFVLGALLIAFALVIWGAIRQSTR